MQVLVSAASKHGATAEIADRIGATLRDRGFVVTVESPDRVEALDEYGAVVLGSGVYAGHWMKDAKNLTDRVAACDPVPPVWLFSSGPLGDPPKPDEEPVDVAKIVEVVPPVEHPCPASTIVVSDDVHIRPFQFLALVGMRVSVMPAAGVSW